MRLATRAFFFLALVALVSLLTTLHPAVQAQSSGTSVVPIGQTVQIKTPLGLPPVPIPADNPPTEETISLGRRLYYDTALSVDNTVSCSTCHMPGMEFTDGKRVSNG